MRLFKWVWGLIKDYVKGELFGKIIDVVLGHPYVSGGAISIAAILSAFSWFQSAPLFAALLVFTVVSVGALATMDILTGSTKNKTDWNSIATHCQGCSTPSMIQSLINEMAVFTSIVGEGDVEYDETIYRLDIRSEKQI